MCRKKKVIVIGSGLGGLSCGVLLAKNGYEVTVLEKGVQAGGCLQCFTRHGVKYETGMHFIGSADYGQTLYKLFRYLEITDKVKLSRLDTTAYDIVELRREKFKFANGRLPFIEQMAEYFPRQRDNIAAYYDLVEKVASASSLHSLKYAETDEAINTEYQLRSIDDVISSTVSDPILSDVLVGNLPLYAACKGKTPFSTHAFIRDFYDQSTFRITGGSDSIATALCKVLEKYGGKVMARSKVTKIICGEQVATAVEINGEQVVQGDIFISDLHPQRTLELLDTHLIRPAFRKRVASLPQTVGGFAVYLQFKENVVPYMNSNYYAYNYNTPWNCENYDEDTWPKGFLYMHFCHEENPRFARCGVILSYMTFDEILPWLGTTVGHRGRDYEDFKRRKAEKLLEELEKRWPGTNANIERYYTSTPLTYYDYTGTEGGSMYGIAKDISLGAAGRIPQRTKVPNVLQTGQNVNSHGMLGVLVGTIVTCSELLTSRTIYEQIIKANEQ